MSSRKRNRPLDRHSEEELMDLIAENESQINDAKFILSERKRKNVLREFKARAFGWDLPIKVTLWLSSWKSIKVVAAKKKKCNQEYSEKWEAEIIDSKGNTIIYINRRSGNKESSYLEEELEMENITGCAKIGSWAEVTVKELDYLGLKDIELKDFVAALKLSMDFIAEQYDMKGCEYLDINE
jgi:hypothetical protein